MTLMRITPGTLAVLVACSTGTAVLVDGGTAAPPPADAGRDGLPWDWDVDPDTDSGPGECIADQKFMGSPPQGWVPYTAYCGLRCGLWVPASSQMLPAPIQWEACSKPLELPSQGLACQQMKFFWPAPTVLYRPSMSPWFAAEIDQGTVVVQLTRFFEANVFRMVAEVDGNVRSAVFEQNGACTLGGSDLYGGKVAYTVYEMDSKGNSVATGMIGGDDSAPKPTRYTRYTDGLSRHYYVGASHFLELGSYQLRRWSDGLVFDQIPPDLQQGDFVAAGDAFVWNASTLAYAKIKARDANGAITDLVSFGLVVNKGTTSVGTDGIDLVWLQGDGRAKSSDPFQKVDIMTSPFTADPNKLVPRRLRSEFPESFWVAETVVGCGYEAHIIVDNSLGRDGVRITRLSDGQSWPLWYTGMSTWQINEPRAITCSEVFLHAYRRDGGLYPENTMVRISLASLGAGVPAD